MECDELLNYYRDRYYEAEARLDNFINIVLLACILILGIIGYYNGAFAEGM